MIYIDDDDDDDDGKLERCLACVGDIKNGQCKLFMSENDKKLPCLNSYISLDMFFEQSNEWLIYIFKKLHANPSHLFFHSLYNKFNKIECTY